MKDVSFLEPMLSQRLTGTVLRSFRQNSGKIGRNLVANFSMAATAEVAPEVVPVPKKKNEYLSMAMRPKEVVSQ